MLSLHQLRPFVVKQGRHWKVLAHDRSKAKAHLGPSSCSVQGRSNSAAPAQAYETALKPGTGLHCPTCTAGLGSVGQLYGVAVIGSHSLMGLVCNSDGTELVGDFAVCAYLARLSLHNSVGIVWLMLHRYAHPWTHCLPKVCNQAPHSLNRCVKPCRGDRAFGRSHCHLAGQELPG
jgi:hypothetical protein